ncbi:MAG: hypothetical protein LBU34_01495, partial [Planctomycetaceae bacterium]|nr:hypothetical protein [Planctomycetaceae bacterium]
FIGERNHRELWGSIWNRGDVQGFEGQLWLGETGGTEFVVVHCSNYNEYVDVYDNRIVLLEYSSGGGN